MEKLFLTTARQDLKTGGSGMSKDFYLPVRLHVELLPLVETAASELTPCRDAETTSGLLSGPGVCFQSARKLNRVFVPLTRGCHCTEQHELHVNFVETADGAQGHLGHFWVDVMLKTFPDSLE